MSDTPEPPKKPRRRIWRRLVGTVVHLCGILIICALAIVFWAKERPIAAPGWVKERIEKRLARDVPQAKVTFGDLRVSISEAWRPGVQLRNVTIKTPDNVELLALSEINTALSVAALLEGRIALRDVSVSGVTALLRRDKSGAVSLRGGQVGTGDAPAQQAASLGALTRQLDDVMAAPALTNLKSAELRALTLRFEDRRANRVWTIDGGRLIATRDGDDLSLKADLALLGGGAGVATLNATYNSRIGAPEADFSLLLEGLPAQDIASQNPAFGWMGILRAPISGAVRSGLHADGSLAPLHATLQIGKGVVQPNAETAPIPFDALRSYFTFDPGEEVLRFDELSVQSKWLSVRGEGTANLAGLEAGMLDSLVGQFRLDGLRANPMDVYPQPIALDGAEMDFQMRFNPFSARFGRVQIADGRTTISADGHVAADPEGWRFAVDAQFDEVTRDRVLELWPEKVVPKTRRWLSENLLKGIARNGYLALRGAPKQRVRTSVAFDFDDLSLRYLKTLPVIEKARGHFSINGKRLVASLGRGVVDTGATGPVVLGASSFIVPDLRVKDGTPAVIRLRAKSALRAALWMLDQKPINALSRAGLPVALGDGAAEFEGMLALPLKRKLPMDEIEFSATGSLRDATSDVLLKGRQLAAKRLAFAATNKKVTITGEGTLDGVPFDGVFEQGIGADPPPGQLSGEVEITSAGLARFGVELPKGAIAGSGTGDLEVTLAKGARPTFKFRSNLLGLRLSVPQVGWAKSPDRKGSFEISGALGDVPRIDALALKGPGLSASGALKLGKQGLERLRLDSLVVGGWLNASVDLVGRGSGWSPRVVVRGGRVDMRKADFDSGTGGSGGGGGSDAPPMDVNLDRLQVTDTIALTGLRGRFATGRGFDGSFAAQVNGGTKIEGRVAPQGGRSAVRLVSQDAGGVFRSAGIIQQARGGSMDLTLVPIGSGGAFDGRLSVKNTRIKDAPSMAAILSAISVVGLLEQMNGGGIRFDDINAEFRLTPGRMTLTRGSATGASMGISMDGVYATQTGQIAMQGVISPVYLVNGIGSVLGRKGEGLIGFNYSLSGLAKSPKVSVNPLSALTPGPLRDLFRGKKTEAPVVDGAPTAKPKPRRPVADAHEDR